MLKDELIGFNPVIIEKDLSRDDHAKMIDEFLDGIGDGND